MSAYSGAERRKLGRPRLVDGEDTSTVSVRLNASLHNSACQMAIREGEDVSAIIRRALQHFVFGNQPER